MTVYRAHPITIVGNLGRVLYLIIIPVVRGFAAALQDGLAGWLSGAWVDILILLLMIGIAVLRWWRVEFWWDNDLVHIKKGVIFRNYIRIPWQKIITVSATRSFFLRPFRAVRLRVDSMGGSIKDPDFSIVLRPETAGQVLAHQGVESKNGGLYTPHTSSILALSLLNSNSFAGVVLIATFIMQGGKLLGNNFSQMIIGTFEEVARTLAFGIPPAAAAIAYLLLGGWLVSFYRSFIRYKNMAIFQQGGILYIRGGVITKREYCVRYEDINFIDIRQSLTTKLFGLYTLFISAVGYGKLKEDISCLIPCEGEQRFKRVRLRLFPDLSPSLATLRPEKSSIMRFIGPALASCLGIPLVCVVTGYYLESWRSFILFVGIMAMIPSGFFMAVRICDFLTSGASRNGDVYTLRYSKGFSLHTVVVEQGKIVQVLLRQSLLQRLGGNCDVLVFTRAEGVSMHTCRNLSLARAEKLFA